MNQLYDAELKALAQELEKVKQEFNEVKKQMVALKTELDELESAPTGQFERPLAID